MGIWYSEAMRTVHRDIVGAFVFSSDDKLLLGKGGVYAGTWIIPGGGIEEGETQLEALARELMEETGVDIANATVEQITGELTGQSEKTLKETGEHVVVAMTFYNYSVKLAEKAETITITTEDDFVEPRWVSVSQLHTLPLSPPTTVTLKKLGYVSGK